MPHSWNGILPAAYSRLLRFVFSLALFSLCLFRARSLINAFASVNRNINLN
jgi:hypothetical protein